MSCCQQGEVYAAESGVPHGASFATVGQLQAWVDALRDEPWWHRFYPQVRKVEVHFLPRGKASVSAWFPDFNAGVIEMLPRHRNEQIVLHEMAHVLASARYGSQAHCPWFCRVYLELVYLVMGEETWSALRNAFQAGGVDFDPPQRAIELGRAREMPA
jgi:putative metallohydrolase (TIGR04338 family)